MVFFIASQKYDCYDIKKVYSKTLKIQIHWDLRFYFELSVVRNYRSVDIKI